MAVVLAIGIVLAIAGIVLLLDLFGAGDFVMRHVTSKYLGSLPPGFANSKRGFRVYSVLVMAIGVIFLGVAAAAWIVPLGIVLLVLGLAAFVVLSVIAIRGEGETARKPKTGI